MRFYRKCAAFLVVLTVLLCGIVVPSYFYGAVPVNDTLFSDNSGHFYVWEQKGDCCTIYQAKNNTMIKSGPSETMTVSEVLCSEDRIFLLVPFAQTLGLYMWAEQPDKAVFVDGVIPKKGCSAVTGNIFYVVDERNSSVIRVYEELCVFSCEVASPEPVICLFTDEQCTEVYALTKKGIFSPSSGKLLSCDVPSEPFVMNDGVCCDADGAVYAFDIQNGFVQTAVMGSTPLCYSEGYFYTYSGNVVYQLDETGTRTGHYVTSGQQISAITASGGQIAVLCGSHCMVFRKGDFQPEEPSEESSTAEPAVSYEESLSESSVRHQVSEVSESSQKRQESKVSQSSVQRQTSKAAENSGQRQEPKVSQSSARRQISQTDGVTSTAHEPERAAEASGQITSDIYTFDGEFLTNIPAGTTIAVLKKHLTYEGYELVICNHHDKITSSGTVGTGFRLIFTSGGEIVREYKTVIMGDVTGEGSRNTLDIRQLAKVLIGEAELDTCQLTAADINRNGWVDLKDLYYLQKAYYGDNGAIPPEAFLTDAS